LTAHIEEAIVHCQGRGISLVRGPTFDYTGPSGNIIACGWDGAVLLRHQKEGIYGQPGWLRELCLLLGEDTYWWWRFHYGFNQGRALQFYREDDNGKRTWFTDKVSETAMKLARRYRLYDS
jgi:hypothetical protein